MAVHKIKDYAIILIYPDGSIDKILADKRKFHMEYYMSLIEESKRLQEIVNKHNISLPRDIKEAKLMLTYELDTKLAEEGIIAFHNLFSNPKLAEELGLEFQEFHITLPNELSMEQKEILSGILSNSKISNSWFGKYDNGEMIDIDYDELKDKLNNKIK